MNEACEAKLNAEKRILDCQPSLNKGPRGIFLLSLMMPLIGESSDF